MGFYTRCQEASERKHTMQRETIEGPNDAWPGEPNWNDDYWDAEDWDAEDERPEWAGERNGGASYISHSPPSPFLPPTNTGPANAGLSATIHPSPPTTRSDNDKLSYTWVYEEDGEFMRIPKRLRAALRDGEITENDYFAFEGIAEKAYSTLFAWGYSQAEYGEGVGLTVDQFRTCEQHLCRQRFLAIEPWRTKDGFRDTSVYILFPRCNKYHIDEIRALRETGSPDPSRPNNAGVTDPVGVTG
jgi:hypothetical protein